MSLRLRNQALNNTEILDRIKGAVAIYSPDKLKRRASITKTIRRSTDSEELDIGFVDGREDVTSAQDFCGVGDGFAPKWHDQSGNGNHAVQPIADNQPQVVTGGIINPHGLSFDGSNDVMPIIDALGLDITGDLTISMIITPTANNGYPFVRNNDSFTTTQYGIYYNNTFVVGSENSCNLVLNGNREQLTAKSSFPVGQKNIYLVTHTSGEQKGYVNGVASGVDGDYVTTLVSQNNVSIGARSNNVNGTAHSIFYQGHISELIIFNRVLSESEILRLVDNQKERYGIL